MAGEFPFEGTGTRRMRVGSPLGFVDNNVEIGVANLLRLSPVKPPYTRMGDSWIAGAEVRLRVLGPNLRKCSGALLLNARAMVQLTHPANAWAGSDDDAALERIGIQDKQFSPLNQYESCFPV